jgi:hypothetical protein
MMWLFLTPSNADHPVARAIRAWQSKLGRRRSRPTDKSIKQRHPNVDSWQRARFPGSFGKSTWLFPTPSNKEPVARTIRAWQSERAGKVSGDDATAKGRIQT